MSLERKFSTPSAAPRPEKGAGKKRPEPKAIPHKMSEAIIDDIQAKQKETEVKFPAGSLVGQLEGLVASAKNKELAGTPAEEAYNTLVMMGIPKRVKEGRKTPSPSAENLFLGYQELRKQNPKRAKEILKILSSPDSFPVHEDTDGAADEEAPDTVRVPNMEEVIESDDRMTDIKQLKETSRSRRKETSAAEERAEQMRALADIHEQLRDTESRLDDIRSIGSMAEARRKNPTERIKGLRTSTEELPDATELADELIENEEKSGLAEETERLSETVQQTLDDSEATREDLISSREELRQSIQNLEDNFIARANLVGGERGRTLAARFNVYHRDLQGLLDQVNRKLKLATETPAPRFNPKEEAPDVLTWKAETKSEKSILSWDSKKNTWGNLKSIFGRMMGGKEEAPELDLSDPEKLSARRERVKASLTEQTASAMWNTVEARRRMMQSEADAGTENFLNDSGFAEDYVTAAAGLNDAITSGRFKTDTEIKKYIATEMGSMNRALGYPEDHNPLVGGGASDLKRARALGTNRSRDTIQQEASVVAGTGRREETLRDTASKAKGRKNEYVDTPSELPETDSGVAELFGAKKASRGAEQKKKRKEDELRGAAFEELHESLRSQPRDVVRILPNAAALYENFYSKIREEGDRISTDDFELMTNDEVSEAAQELVTLMAVYKKAVEAEDVTRANEFLSRARDIAKRYNLEDDKDFNKLIDLE